MVSVTDRRACLGESHLAGESSVAFWQASAWPETPTDYGKKLPLLYKDASSLPAPAASLNALFVPALPPARPAARRQRRQAAPALLG